MKLTFEIEDKDIRSFAANFSDGIQNAFPVFLRHLVNDPIMMGAMAALYAKYADPPQSPPPPASPPEETH